jgi:hypothetical protein
MQKRRCDKNEGGRANGVVNARTAQLVEGFRTGCMSPDERTVWPSPGDRDSSAALHRTREPGLRDFPFSMHGPLGDLKDFRRFVDGETAETK